MTLKRGIIIIGIFGILIGEAMRVCAQTGAFFSQGEARIPVLREFQNQSRVGYTYDSYEEQKQLIFRQLEIISGDEETRYIIVPGDTMTISYDDRAQRQGAVYKVSSKGKIYLPLIGAVKVEGLNRQQARAVLGEMFKVYIRQPKVDLTVNTSGRIMVLGAVGQPGLYFLQPNLTLMEAILNAGSYDEDDAKIKSVVVMRGGRDNPQVMRLNLRKMLTKGDRTDDILIKPGDLVCAQEIYREFKEI